MCVGIFQRQKQPFRVGKFKYMAPIHLRLTQQQNITMTRHCYVIYVHFKSRLWTQNVLE
jgi:hypothetical protein